MTLAADDSPSVSSPSAIEAPAVSFQPLTRDQLPLPHDWLNRPHVAEWWTPEPSLVEVEEEFLPYLDPTSLVRPYTAIANAAPVGFIQSYVAMNAGDGWWPDERDPGVRGIDQFLADAGQLGRGLGTAMVRAFVARLFADPSVTRVQTDPSTLNARAIRCYEKAGFHRVREVDTPDGRELLMICERADFVG